MDEIEIFRSSEGVLGLRFFTGTVTDVPLEPFVARPGEVPDVNGYFSRDGELVRAIGPNDEMLFAPDQFDPGPLAPLIAGDDAPIDQLSGWTVTVNGQAVGIDDLYRKSKAVESSQGVNLFDVDFVQEHVINLDLADTLVDGDVVAVTGPGNFGSRSVTLDSASQRSEAIHVNQNGFDPDDPSKLAFLSTWLGIDPDLPEAQQVGANGLDYEIGTAFHVLDAETGQRVFTGAMELYAPVEQANRSTGQNLASTDTYVLDFTDLDREGEYVIEVEGVGTSYDFTIGENVWQDIFEHGMRGFYHQRSGIALEAEFTDWTRPASLPPSEVVYRSTASILETGNAYNRTVEVPAEFEGNGEDYTFSALTAGATDEIVEGAWGGWHDAGDWDRRTQHLEPVNQMLELVEINPGFFEGIELGIPETGNPLPDVIDEGLWTLDMFVRLQEADGGVGGGIEAGTGFEQGEASWTNSRPLYAYASDPWSSAAFAATAARAGRVIEDYDAARAGTYLDAAIFAFDWALDNWIEPGPGFVDQTSVNARNLAALELYRATGDQRYHDDFKATSSYSLASFGDYQQWQPDAVFAYLSMPDDMQDAPFAAQMEARFLERADRYVDGAAAVGSFGNRDDPDAPYTFGNTAVNPELAADYLVRAHALTGADKYLIAAIEDANFALGANPDNISFLSGWGDEQVREMLVADAEALGREPPPGLVAYGSYNAADGFQNFWQAPLAEGTFPASLEALPAYESWQGYYYAVPISEFTVDEPMGSSAYLWGYLAQLGEEQINPGNGLGSFLEYEVQLGTTATFIDIPGDFTALQIGLGDTAEFGDGVVADLAQDAAGVRLLAQDLDDSYPWVRQIDRLDLDDRFAWDRVTTTFGEGNQRLANTAVYDDGRVAEVEFIDGQRSSVAWSDVANEKIWSEVLVQFEAGQRVLKTVTLDNLDVVTTTFENATAVERVVFDGSERRPWETKTTTFDANGDMIDVILA